MTLRVELSRRAIRDIADIWDYSAATWSKAQASRYIACLRRSIEMISASPATARLHGEYDPPVRIFRVRSHVIAYRVDDDVLRVVRILHVRSDLAAHMGG